MKRDFLTVRDLSKDELKRLIDRALEMKKGVNNKKSLEGKSIGLLFRKPSTRTRVSFEVSTYQLGGQSIYLNPSEMQLSRGESTKDTAKVLSRYLHGIVIRTYAHREVEDFARYASIPVINGLTDLHHPCQALADLLTIKEHFNRMEGLRLAYIGDGNNVVNSLIEAASMTGMNIVIACPEGYEPIEKASNVVIVREPKEAAKGADILYTDVWISMGDEEKEEKVSKFKGFQINKEVLSVAKEDAIVLHCLPAHIGQEITEDVLYGERSRVFEEAENRLHAQKALLEMLIM
ncbi:MAG: ornithine carbamoyltransferase [Nitrospirae bacterium]|nr:MAG: ornithine carbamoyltransferase [Nitrospirota bacterium]